MARMPSDAIVMLRVTTDVGLGLLQQDAARCHELADRFGPTTDRGRVFQAIAQGFDMIIKSSPEQISDAEILREMIKTAGRKKDERLTHYEQTCAIDKVRRRVEDLRKMERTMLQRPGQRYQYLATPQSASS